MFIPTAQQQAVITHERSAFVSACPGAGKTRVLVERARHLLRPSTTGRGVAFLSFTNAALSELAHRLQREGFVSSPPFPHFLGTFDAFLWQFFIVPFGLPGFIGKPVLIPDKDGRSVRPNPGMRELPLKCFDRETGGIIAAEVARERFDVDRATTARYENAARQARARFLARGEVDFADVRAVAAGRLNEPVMSLRLATALGARFQEVIVDEAQDCNPADLEIIAWLRQANITTKVICDPHQAIYSFRGGVTEELNRFREMFDAVDQLPMTGNFRSSDHICKAITALRDRDARADVDQAHGEFKDDPLPITLLAYGGRGVPNIIGSRFAEILAANDLELAQCPVLASTRHAGCGAIGQPSNSETQDLTLRLAMAVTGFHFAAELGDRRTALQDLHCAALDVQGVRGRKTYHQYIVSEGIEADVWRPAMISFARALRFDANTFPNPDAWLQRARDLLAPGISPDVGSINQRLRRNTGLAAALAAPQGHIPRASTIHAVKGMEFPAVCVVLTPKTAKSIIDYLLAADPANSAEDARKIYVAASRAQRLLVIAVPNSQSTRLRDHFAGTGAAVELLQL